MQQKVPRCPSCRGVVKPDITFFGEKLPGSVKRAVEADHKKVRQDRAAGNADRTTAVIAAVGVLYRNWYLC